MKEKQSITPKELADAFDMKVLDLARFTGYSKQGLYQILDGTNGVCSNRMFSTIKLLEMQSKEMLQKDIEMAQKKARAREHAIFSLKEALGIPQ